MPPAPLQNARRTAFQVAYRMLGSVAEAEDVAQEAVVRLDREPGDVENPDAWVTTVATRLSIDVLRSARVRREAYVGPWLPEPLLVDPGPGPAAQSELADTLSQALLVALERLTPVERAAFLLREVFDYDYARIAEIVDREEANTRQLVTRAKKHVAAGRPRFDADDAARERLLDRFVAAVDEGDLRGLEALLAEDVVLWGDGGGVVRAALRPVRGPADVARFLVHTARLRGREDVVAVERVPVNGQPGLLLRRADGTVTTVTAIDVVDGRIAALRSVRNPEKLAHLAR
ncbi:RNA polymerase sigma-70 factor [Patulibacter minatonensis]|uniref:RNA polymerase sigma-70 factor n=1 Tax=Patulibacter minatonensis TaxID=298163 RepID=UPI00047B229F|nr:RNA polymerase sigma-70 factor [Patulibacter minatonensis]